jgi:hypothetical protein
MLLSSYPQKTQKKTFNMRQDKLTLLFTISAAAAFEEVDSTPIEGFDPDACDKILNLRGTQKLRDTRFGLPRL